jgi:phage terminase large subunit-like protein
VREQVRKGFKNIALIGPTAADVRDVMIEGTSGILAVSWALDQDRTGRPMGIPVYEPTKRRVTWANGAMATGYSAQEPDRLRGPQHDAMWCDELAAWANAVDTWDMAMLGLRIGTNPQVMISTTPRPVPLVRELLRLKSCVTTIATTYDNLSNLSPGFFDRIITKYHGTRLGRQELLGQIIEETEGALSEGILISIRRYSPNLSMSGGEG